MKKHQNRKNSSYLIYSITGIAVLLIAGIVLCVLLSRPAVNPAVSDETLQSGQPGIVSVSAPAQDAGNPAAPGTPNDASVSQDPAVTTDPSSGASAEVYVPEGDEVPIEMPSASDPVTVTPAPIEAGVTPADNSSSGSGQNTSTDVDQGSTVSPIDDDGAIWLPEVP